MFDKSDYKLVKDGKRWNVLYVPLEVYESEISLTLKEARRLLSEITRPESSHYADENPLWE